jgi:2'-5' RNA ligase
MVKIRTFIAVTLPEQVLNELNKLIEAMRPYARGIKWVKPQSIHLTLKFLGNISSAELEKVYQALERIFQSPHEQFILSTGKPGVFPGLKKPRVFWIGVSGSGLLQLERLQNEVEESLYQEGFPKEERNFSPHLTIGRVKDRVDLPLLTEKFSAYDFPECEIPVRELQVMKSDLKPSGAVYSVQKSYRLR